MSEPWTVYRCSYCEEGSACGFNGSSLDYSYDECHHPLLLEVAERMAAGMNAFEVMMRRGWTASETGGRWLIDLTPKLATSLKTMTARKWFVETSFADPFTALVEADKWYKENVETKDA